MLHLLHRHCLRLKDRRGFTVYSCLSISLFVNAIFFLSYSRERGGYDDPCLATLNRVEVQKVMEYIKEKKNGDSVARDALLDELLRCMKESKEDDSKSDMVRINTILRKLSGSASDQKDLNTRDSKPPLASANESKASIEAFLAKPVINPYGYSYVFDQSGACSDVNLKFIIAVPSAPSNFENRMKVRRNHAGSFAKDSRNRAKLIFFLGTVSENTKDSLSIQKHIEREQNFHGDIVQARFIDNFRNLTKKAALLLKWSSTFCDHSKFVLRTDDDLRVNLTKMTAAMEQELTDSNNNNNKNSHFILGKIVKDWGPVRDKKSKYYTTMEEYPYLKLPDFILGGSMGYSVATADLLFKAYTRLRPFWLDDVFITAMCAPRVGVAIKNSTAFVFEHWKW